jgi:HNH endonuclease
MTGRRRQIQFYVNERGCHICVSHRTGTHGYPCTNKNGAGQNLHHVLYEETFGPIPFGWVVRHTCDDRMCINMDHMILGTKADNSRDIVERGRRNYRALQTE